MSTELPAELTAALAGRYDLRRVVGQGGMATVYHAFDSRHQRDVALKILLPGLAAQVGAERFIKEIRIAARLTHPHILPLYDSGEAAGFLYYVMPYLREPSLRQRLATTRRLEPHEALTIVARVADALTYAHRMGILHRDIKPENVLFAEGHPIVADFGIAKAISSASGGANLTRTGFPLGTPGYMSPEQAAGLRDLDARTDVYGLAALTYELLVGDVLPPGRWPADEALRAGRFRDVPVGHRARLDELGAGIEAALVRALALSHDQRTASAQEFIAALSVPPPRRRYDADEVQAIVRRATALEASQPTAGGSLTLGGVEALAAEVDLAPALVREAARSLTPLGPAPRELVGPTRERFRDVAYSMWQLMDPTTPPDERWGFTDLLGVVFFSVITAGILPMVFLGIASSRRRRLRRFFQHGTPALAEIIDFRPEEVGFEVKLTRVRYEFMADGQLQRGSDLTLPVIADRWRAGDRIEILYLGRNYDSMIATAA